MIHTKQSDSRPREERNRNETLRFMHKQQKDTRILLYMPDDLFELYKEPLMKRVTPFGVNLVVARPDTPPDKIGSFQCVITYQCALPVSDENSAENKAGLSADLSGLSGTPPTSEMTPFERDSIWYTSIDKRFLSLLPSVQFQENNDDFQVLVEMQNQIREKLNEVSLKQSELDQLAQKIKAVDAIYFDELGYFLKEAIDNVLQLVALGDVMKRYIKILIVDDMGDRSLDQLEERGFRKRYVSTMSLHTFNRAFHDYKKKFLEAFPDRQASLLKLFYKSAIFKDNEIVVYNPWMRGNDDLTVQFRLKKHPDLSKREKRTLDEGPEKIAQKVEKIEIERAELDDQLREVKQKLYIAETQGGQSESHYVALNKKRKRILKRINRTVEQLKELQKKISGKPHYIFYTRNFKKALTNRKLVKKLGGKEKPKVENLDLLAATMHHKKKIQQEIRLLNRNIKTILNDMESFADQRFPDSDIDYHQYLGVHTLNKLELTVLGCSIASLNSLMHAYTGPYYQLTGAEGPLPWDHDRISRTSIYLASKGHPLNTACLRFFFRIEESEQSNRLYSTFYLPQQSDFDNDTHDLFIFNLESYTLQDIVDCLKKRKQSLRPFAPVLIIDPNNKVESRGQKQMIEMLIGLKRETGDAFSLETPPYKVSSLDVTSRLPKILCEILGIREDTIPAVKDFDQAVLHHAQDADISGLTESESSVQEKDTTRADPVSEEDLEVQISERIEISLPEEETEEIYTLGSLFSFDDSDEIPTIRPAEDSAHREIHEDKNEKEQESETTPEKDRNEENPTDSNEDKTEKEPSDSGEDIIEQSHLF